MSRVGRMMSVMLVMLLALPAMAAARSPNIVLFLADDMGWVDSEPYGSQYYRTPAMSQFARQAMRFTSAYASPTCSPTRASILTGQYPSRHGMFKASGHLPPFASKPVHGLEKTPSGKPMAMPASLRTLSHEQYTLAEALQAAGYRTAHIGKWHIGLTEPYWPAHYGFDEVFHGAPDASIPSYFSPYGFKSYQSFADGPDGEYITDRLTDEAIRFVKANRDKPFFLNLWHYSVHGPWGHKEAYTQAFVDKKDPTGRQGNPIMASMLQSVDESFQRLMTTLDELGIADNTIVIFMSDNGGNAHSNSSKDRAWPKALALAKKHPGGQMDQSIKAWQRWAGDLPPTNNAPLRGSKGTLYEGGVRVPLMVRWPGHIAAGTTNAEPVSAIDLYPTILGLLGQPLPGQQVIDGIDLTPALLRHEPLARDAVFHFYPVRRLGGVAVRSGPWKLIRWTQLRPENPQRYDLYNLDEDIGESHNLAAAMPGKVRELDALIDRFLADTHAVMPQPNPAFGKHKTR